MLKLKVISTLTVVNVKCDDEVVNVKCGDEVVNVECDEVVNVEFDDEIVSRFSAESNIKKLENRLPYKDSIVRRIWKRKQLEVVFNSLMIFLQKIIHSGSV